MQIRLKKFGKVFSSRNRAHELFDTLKDGEVLELDFIDVEQVTPSFLHEVLNILKQKESKLEVKNLNESIDFQMKKAEAAS